jgi:flagellar hook-basal body complex protein FliE
VIVPAIGAVAQAAANSPYGAGQLEGLAQSGSAGQGIAAGQSAPAGQSGAAGQSEQALQGAAGTGAGGGFSGALTEAVSSLEKTQQSADSAARALATGTTKSPESAILTVQDAQLAMQLAAQIRTKAVEATQSIFQTQV